MEQNFSITVLSNACGISAPNLRIWEKRYQAFSPSRDEAGQRLYSEKDLQRSKMIAALLDQGHAISSVARLELDDLRKLLESNSGELQKFKTKVETRKILHLLEKYNLDELIHEFQFHRISLGARDFIFKIVLPVMQEVGLLVAKGRCSVTQEHIISSIVRDQLSKVTLTNFKEESKKFAIATPEGNLHELAILIADIICKINRVPANYLGAAHPAQSLGEAISVLKCQTIVLGVISSDQWDYEDSMSDYLLTLDEALTIKVSVILGGGWKLNFPKFKNLIEIKYMNNFEEFDQFLSGAL
jgi:DNA-binding transcriptional MerR regulator